MLFNLSDYGLLTLHGIGAEKLLQGQLTCNVAHASTTQSLLGAHCNPKGRVISFFHLFRYHDDYCLLMHKSMLSIAQTTLQKYAPFYKVTLSIENSFFIYGSDAKIDDESILACLTLHATHERYLILSNAKPTPLQQNDWHHYDLQDGITTIYPETSAVFLPHELNLTLLGAIDFAKGCYTGQEIIARLEYLGKQKQALFFAESTDVTLKPGSEIVAVEDPNRSIGTVVDTYQQANHLELLVLTQATTQIPITLQINSGQAIHIIKKMSSPHDK